MTRSMSSAMATQVSAGALEPVLLFEAEFVSGTLRAWSGYGDLTWGGYTWTGTGTLLSVGDVQESGDGSATGVTASLNGVPSELVSLALSDARQGASGRVYVGALSDGAIVADPILLFEGRLDVPVIQDDAEAPVISISYESRLIDLQRPREVRYTAEEQKALFAGDLGCDFVAGLQEAQITWGRA